MRQHAAQRRRGEDAAALETWREILVRNLDRINVAVAAFKFEGGARLPVDEHGTVVSLAYLRLEGLVFRGHSVGELRETVRQWVWNACMDHGRAELRHARRAEGSLDEAAFDEEGDRSRFESDVARVSREREALEVEAVEEAERRYDYTAWVREAIAEVSNASYREVLELTYIAKLDAAQISERLRISLDNVYQRRRRGKVELERNIRDRRR